MRTAFIETLCELAEKNEKIWLVCGDLGYSVLEVFHQKYPKRFVNAGVAEQNMTGLAAGLSMTGKKVVTYSIVNFATLRCIEQIRNDVCYHEADVKIVSVGGGFAYGNLGYTHHGIEDIAMMRSLPNMTIFAPADRYEARWATKAMMEHSGPCYLRLEKAREIPVHAHEIQAQIGQSLLVRQGTDVSLCAAGGILKNTLDAAEILKAQKIEARVLSFPTIKPLDGDALLKAYRETNIIVTIEEHSATGGFGSAVLDLLQENNCDTRKSLRLAAPNAVPKTIGSQEFLREACGLSPQKIAESVIKKLKSGRL